MTLTSLLVLNIFHIFFSIVSVLDLEQVNVSWGKESVLVTLSHDTENDKLEMILNLLK